MKYLLIVAAVLFVIDLIITRKCLQLIVDPIHYTEQQIRDSEIRDGFPEGIKDYEEKWKREPFTLENDKAILSGEFIDNPDASGKAVIIAHGHTANRYASLKYAKLFYDLGFQVVIYDERSFGQSTGDFCTLGEKESADLAKIIDLTRQRYGDVKLVLHGESMGAATSLLVLRYRKVDLVFADCPFADSQQLFSEFVVRNLHVPPFVVIPLLNLMALIRYGYHIKETSPIEAVRNADVPICFFHGEDDALIVCEHSKQMLAVCKDPRSRLELFPKAIHAHSMFIDRERYRKIVVEMLKECSI